MLKNRSSSKTKLKKAVIKNIGKVKIPQDVFNIASSRLLSKGFKREYRQVFTLF